MDVWQALRHEQRFACARALWGMPKFKHRERLTKRAAQALGGVSARIVRTKPHDEVANALAGVRDFEPHIVAVLLGYWYHEWAFRTGIAAAFHQALGAPPPHEHWPGLSEEESSSNASLASSAPASWQEVLGERDANDVIVYFVLLRNGTSAVARAADEILELIARHMYSSDAHAIAESPSDAGQLLNAASSLEARLAEVRKQFAVLGGVVRRLADDLERGELPYPLPSAAPWEQLDQQVRALLQDIRREVSALGGESEVTNSDAPLRLADADTALLRLHDLLARSPIQERVTTLLLKAQSLAHESDPTFGPIQAVRDVANEELRRVPTADLDSLRQQLEPTLPICALIRLVEESSTLEDTEFARATDVVRSAFGDLVATAAIRGRLRIAAPDTAAVPESSSLSTSDPRGLTSAESAGAVPEADAGSNAENAENYSLRSPLTSNEGPETVSSMELGASLFTEEKDALTEESLSFESTPPDTRPPKYATPEGRGRPSDSSSATEEAGLAPWTASEGAQATPDATLVAESPEARRATSPSSSHADNEQSGQAEEPSDELSSSQEPSPVTSEIAEALAQSAPLVQQAWGLLSGPTPEFAYHLTVAAEIRANEDGGAHSVSFWHLPAWLVAAVCCSPHLVDAQGSLAEWYQQRLASEDVLSLVNATDSGAEARQLLLAAALLRPALLAPAIGADRTLEALRHLGNYPTLRTLCHQVARFSITGRPITPEVIRQVRTQADWHAEMQSLQDEAAAWLDSAHSFTIVYQAASNVWRKWIERDGIIGRLLKIVRMNDATQIDLLRREVDRLSDDAALRREVDSTDRALTVTRRRNGPIQASALKQLQNHTETALSFARRWLSLRDFNPDSSEGRRLIAAQELRTSIEHSKTQILRELRARTSARHDPRLSAAARRLETALDDLGGVFNREESVLRPEPSLDHCVNAALLRFPAIRLTPEWSLDQDARPVPAIVGTLDQIAEGLAPDWSDVVDKRLALNDFIGVALLLQHLSSTQVLDGQRLDELSQRRAEAFSYAVNALRGKIERTRLHCERAVFNGIIGEAEHSELMTDVEGAAKVASASELLLTSVRFEDIEQRLVRIEHQLARYTEASVDEVRLQLAESRDRIPEDSEADQLICALLQKSDVLTAQEYVEHLRSGSSLEELRTHEDRRELDQFLEFLAALESNSALTALAARHALDQRGQFGPLDFSGLTEAQAADAAKVLRSWSNTRGQRNNPADKFIETLFRFLGFSTSVEHVSTESGTTAWSRLQTMPIGDPALCPVPAFGSAAHGKYEVLWIWGEPVAEDVLARIRARRPQSPVVVLYFGLMPSTVRYDLRRRCREEGVRCVVLDEALMIFLTAQAGARMGIFFRCALPFTFLIPYQTTGGEVPPELFVGRRHESMQIQEVGGPCFVYGGRQLGKTALLRDVQRHFDDRQNGQVAIYLDLKAEGVGITEEPQSLWRYMARELKAKGIVDSSDPALPRLSSLPPEAAFELTDRTVSAWLRVPSRRILVLLDESDRFFEQEATPEAATGAPFRVSDRLKGLMDRTSRRFKVVFAGLHNVKRTTRLENHPLAHLGTPICIGPLLGGREWRSAAELVRRPLAALGYQLDDTLIMRVLSQTNYYPSLIQLYCDALMRHVLDRSRGLLDTRVRVPVSITGAQLEAAYTSKELRTVIREKLSLTLQLDPRYRVLALVLALAAHRVDSPELTVQHIREDALYWWSEGFGDETTEDSFRALLDEMVGLGVVREVDGGRKYALRSSNVMHFLGTQADIEHELLTLPSADTYRGYAPFVHRRAWKEGGVEHSTRRSPLTVQQELDLASPSNAVTLICGTPLGGLAEVEPFCHTLPGRGVPDCVLGERATIDAFTDELQRLLRREEGTFQVLVSDSAPWSEEWLHRANDLLQTRTSKRRFVRPIFVAGPNRLWDLLDTREGVADDLSRLGIQIVTLKAWSDSAIVQWAEDMGVSAANATFPLARLREVTGGWPLLLSEQAELVRSSTSRSLGLKLESALTVLSTEQRRAEILETLGIREGDRMAVLTALSEYGEAMATEDLKGLLDPSRHVSRVLAWADMLGITERVDMGCWRLSRFIHRVLTNRAAQ